MKAEVDVDSLYPGVTIDGAHSRDLDDAIWVERSGSGWLVTVCVSLVSEVVPSGSEVDLQARRQGTTRYRGSSEVVSMLPRALAHDACSLLPGEPRLVLAIRIGLDAGLNQTRLDVGRGLLEHRGRLDHIAASGLIDGGEPRLHAMMGDAWQLARRLLEHRRSAGALALFSQDLGVVADEEGRLVDLSSRGRAARAHLVVQEMMILANAALAAGMAAAGVPLLYRNHRASSVADRGALAGDLDLAVEGDATAVARMGHLLGRASLESAPGGHYGLNLPCYAWFTSPIRRYADLVNHRMLLAHLDGALSPLTSAELDVIGRGLNELAWAEADALSESYKGEAARRGERWLQQRRSFHTLDAAQMTAVIWSASEAGWIPDALAGEIRVRLARGGLTHKDLVRLLMPGRPGMESTTGDVVAAMMDDAHHATGTLLHLVQSGRAQPAWFTQGVRQHGAGVLFSCSAAAIIDDVEYLSPEVSAPTRKLAAQRATVLLLSAAAGLPVTPPTAWIATQPDKGLPTQATPLERDPKSVLQELCQARGWSLPSYKATSTGPAHAPLFSARVATNAGHAEGKAGTRREAEKAAAAALLAGIM